MKKLITLVLILASFLGGYCLGHIPGSPDLDKPIAAAWRWAKKQLGTLRESKADVPARRPDRPKTSKARPDPSRHAPPRKPDCPLPARTAATACFVTIIPVPIIPIILCSAVMRPPTWHGPGRQFPRQA